jgi:hypothetical protein
MPLPASLDKSNQTPTANSKRMQMNAPKTLGALTLILIFMIIPVAACFTHGQCGFLIAGTIFFPVAVIHGIGIWFGFWPA